MPKYDLSFNPPAPFANVELENLLTGETISGISLMLDTGADVTLLPNSVMEKLGNIKYTDTLHEIETVDGARTRLKSVVLTMKFLNRQITGKFLVSHDKEGVLGRDILNELKLVFDGKNLEWSEDASN